MPAKTPLSMGLIGCGRMGGIHLQAMAALDEIRIAAVVDPAVDQSPYPLITIDELLRASDVEAVLVATPTASHSAIVRSALNAGKHVLCEKPLTLDPEMDLALEKLAKDQELILQVGLWRRFAAPYLALREILDQRRLGDIKSVRTAQWDASPPPAAFCDPKISGGLEIDCGIHEFDLVRWLTGSTAQVIAAISPAPAAELSAVGDVDSAVGLVLLSDRRVMTIDLTRTAGHRDSIRTELICERGSVIAELTQTARIDLRLPDALETLTFADDPLLGALTKQLVAFVEGVEVGHLVSDAAGAADSRYSLLAAQTLRDARIRGGWRPLDL